MPVIKEEGTQVTHILLKSIRTTLEKEGDSVTTYVTVTLALRLGDGGVAQRS